MKTKCKLCGKTSEDNLCEFCLEFLGYKYRNKKELKKILQWYKNHTQLNEE